MPLGQGDSSQEGYRETGRCMTTSSPSCQGRINRVQSEWAPLWRVLTTARCSCKQISVLRCRGFPPEMPPWAQ